MLSAEGLRPGQHDVALYGTDDALIEELVQYAGEGVLAEDGVIIIATLPHIAALRAALVSVGIDIDRAERDGRLRFADAQATLDTFLVDHYPDRALFQQRVTELVQRTRGRSTRQTPIRVFGEMVNLLWQTGRSNASLSLESLWNDLAPRQGIALLCAYEVADADRDGRIPGFQALCDKHDHVTHV